MISSSQYQCALRLIQYTLAIATLVSDVRNFYIYYHAFLRLYECNLGLYLEAGSLRNEME